MKNKTRQDKNHQRIQKWTRWMWAGVLLRILATNKKLVSSARNEESEEGVLIKIPRRHVGWYDDIRF